MLSELAPVGVDPAVACAEARVDVPEDGARRALAQRLVVEGTLELGAVATRIGFSDLAAFGKAFRRWFGEAPSMYGAALWQARDGIERAQVPAPRGE